MNDFNPRKHILERLTKGEITRTQAKSQLTWLERAKTAQQSERIAIIGIAGRYPGANDPGELWDLIKAGRSAIDRIEDQRWSHSRFYSSDREKAGTTHATHAGFLDEIDSFDTLLFKIAPRDAEKMDPLNRVFLEVAWSAFESAGYSLERLSQIRALDARVGVFAGACFQQYHHHSSDDQFKADNLVASFGTLVGRVSQCFDLNGPSIALDTACSSSMMALHLAVSSLLAGECQMALAGGVNLTEHPLKLVGLKHLLSDSDRSRPFADAGGYISSEGVGAVLLKPLSKAIEDRDFIHATIDGSAVGHAGKGDGYSVPNADEQFRVMRQCLSRAGVAAEAVSCVEAAALGAVNVDGAEFTALNQIFGEPSAKPVSLGTIKSNIGHCEAASTMAQLTKVLLQFKHETFAPTINALPSPLDFSKTSLRLQLEGAPWTKSETGRLALINSTGATGAYGALLLREYRQEALPRPTDGPVVVPISAGREDIVRIQCQKLGGFLRRNPTLDLRDVAFTLQVGRNHLMHRVAMVATTLDELSEMLEAVVDEGLSVERPRIFSGQVRIPEKREKIPHGSPEDAAVAWCKGAQIDWYATNLAETAWRLPLPTYVFHRRKCWIGEPGAAGSPNAKTARISQPSQNRSVVVIGAGPAGLAAAKCLQDEGLDPIVLEKTDRIGGIWTFRENYAGGPYKSTLTQNSKYTFFFSDFPPPENAPVFCAVNDVNDYLHGYVEQFGLKDRISLNSQVLQVERSEEEWSVTSYNPQQGLRKISALGVLCCSGSYWEPRIPDVPGREAFRGLQLASSAYHSNEIFTGKRVLIVGAGVSGADIASDAAETAAVCCWSVRSCGWFLPRMVGFTPNDCSVSFVRRFINQGLKRDDFLASLRRALPDYVERYEKTGLIPDRCPSSIVNINDRAIDHIAQGRIAPREELVELTGSGAIFSDGRSEKFDIIVYCTGYAPPTYEYLRPITLDQFRGSLFFKERATLGICNSSPGVGGFGAGLPYFELIARWYAGIVSGRYKPPGENDPCPESTSADGFTFFDSWMESLKVARAIGVLPDPCVNWGDYWKFVNTPPIPSLFRLHGPLGWPDADRYLQSTRRKFFLKQEDKETADVKIAVLAGMGGQALEQLRSAGQITNEEFRAALGHTGQKLSPWLAPLTDTGVLVENLAMAS